MSPWSCEILAIKTFRAGENEIEARKERKGKLVMASTDNPGRPLVESFTKTA